MRVLTLILTLKKYTDFFGAASIITDDIAWGAGKTGHIALPLTIGADDYYDYGNKYITDMEQLSSMLEDENIRIYKRVKNKDHVPGITDAPDRQTANHNFVHHEQSLVEDYLNQINPEERKLFARLNNELLNSWTSRTANRVLGPISENGVSYLGDFLEKFREENGGVQFDFNDQHHREALGRFLVDKKQLTYEKGE